MSRELELMEGLIQQAEHATYQNKEIDFVLKRAEMLIRKILGENALPYLKSLNDISFNPIFFMTDSPESVFINSFNSGKKQLLDLLKVAKEEIEFDFSK